MSSLESVWKYRADVLYPQLFGEPSAGIYVLEGEIFTDVFKQETYDPRWLHLGVFEYPPTPTRDSWLYVTSGGSTPWEAEPSEYDPNEYSWLGVELVMESPVQATWPIFMLQRLLAYNVLICHGRYGDIAALDYGHRIPLGGPPTDDSVITHVMLVEPDHYPASQQLDSGLFDFLHVVGISIAERDYAKQQSSDDLALLLKQNNAFAVTDCSRASFV